MKILVTGGAGYIGSVTSQELVRAGHKVTIIDRFQNHRLPTISCLDYLRGDLLKPSEIKDAIEKTQPDAIMHFAAYIQMGESMRDPRKYYENNFVGSFNLANIMVEQGVKQLIFSSSAGVYGNPKRLPIQEDDPQIPTNPYGETKLSIERMFRWYEKPYGLRSISIRYFNAAGASLDQKLGETHEPESHLIPNLILSQIAGREFTLFGNDYSTKDGTCVRDYVHVVDLASAHIKALDALVAGAPSNYYNAGSGTGFSNLEIVQMVERISGRPVKLKFLPRRPGDADELVADVRKIKSELAWSPQYSDLETIVKTAYSWHNKI